MKTPDSEEKVRQSDLYLGLCTEVILVILGCQKVIPIFILWAPLTYHSHCPGGIACRLGARFNPLSQVWRPFLRDLERLLEKKPENPIGPRITSEKTLMLPFCLKQVIRLIDGQHIRNSGTKSLGTKIEAQNSR